MPAIVSGLGFVYRFDDGEVAVAKAKEKDEKEEVQVEEAKEKAVADVKAEELNLAGVKAPTMIGKKKEPRLLDLSIEVGLGIFLFTLVSWLAFVVVGTWRLFCSLRSGPTGKEAFGAPKSALSKPVSRTAAYQTFDPTLIPWARILTETAEPDLSAEPMMEPLAAVAPGWSMADHIAESGVEPLAAMVLPEPGWSTPHFGFDRPSEAEPPAHVSVVALETQDSLKVPQTKMNCIADLSGVFFRNSRLALKEQFICKQRIEEVRSKLQKLHTEEEEEESKLHELQKVRTSAHQTSEAQEEECLKELPSQFQNFRFEVEEVESKLQQLQKDKTCAKQTPEGKEVPRKLQKLRKEVPPPETPEKTKDRRNAPSDRPSSCHQKCIYMF